MKASAIFLMTIISSTAFSNEPCPSYLEVESKILDNSLEPAIWQPDFGWKKTNRDRLKIRYVSNFFGFPDARKDLVIYPFYYSVPRRRIDSSEKNWVACSYEGTSIELVRSLPDGASACLYYPKDEVVKCLFDAPKDPEDQMPKSLFGGQNLRAVAVFGSTRSCQLKINGLSAGLLKENKSRAIYIPIGEAAVECQDERGKKSVGIIFGITDRDVPFRFLWDGEANHWEALRDLKISSGR